MSKIKDWVDSRVINGQRIYSGAGVSEHFFKEQNVKSFRLYYHFFCFEWKPQIFFFIRSLQPILYANYRPLLEMTQSMTKRKAWPSTFQKNKKKIAKMYINIKQETAANYPQSPKLWCIRPLELVFSTNYLTSQGLVSPFLKFGFQCLSNLRRILDRIITNGSEHWGPYKRQC